MLVPCSWCRTASSLASLVPSPRRFLVPHPCHLLGASLCRTCACPPQVWDTEWGVHMPSIASCATWRCFDYAVLPGPCRLASPRARRPSLIQRFQQPSRAHHPCEYSYRLAPAGVTFSVALVGIADSYISLLKTDAPRSIAAVVKRLPSQGIPVRRKQVIPPSIHQTCTSGSECATCLLPPRTPMSGWQSRHRNPVVYLRQYPGSTSRYRQVP